MKKFPLILLAISLALFGSGIMESTAIAASGQRYSTMTKVELAYCDIDKAPEAWKDAILIARDEVIHSTSWTVNGQTTIELVDGTIQELPEFSDLFPNWDVPISKNVVFQTRTANYAGYVYLRNPTTSDTLPFYSFYAISNRITMGADSLPGTSWNGAYTDLDTNQEVGYAVNMSPTTKYNLYNPYSNHAYGARASTYSTEGDALMYVAENPM